MSKGRFCDLIITRHAARFCGQILPVSIGFGGIGDKIGEGDGITPRGSHRLLSVKYRADRITPLVASHPHMRGVEFTPIHRNDIWIDDANSPNYNQGLRSANTPYSHETLHRPDNLYDLIGILDFNINPTRAGAGSAIFLHLWRGPRQPTAGCIAFQKNDLLWIFQNWTPQSRVVVL